MASRNEQSEELKKDLRWKIVLRHLMGNNKKDIFPNKFGDK